MLPTKIYDFNLIAGGSQRLLVAGAFFKLLLASGNVRVDSDFGTIEPMSQGQGLQKTPFSYLYFTDKSGGANTIRVVIGDENFIDNSVGSVSIASNKAPISSIMAQTTPAIGVASAQILAANANRQYLLVQNKDPAAIVYVYLGAAAATAANGIQLAPGGSFVMENCQHSGAVQAISTVAAPAVVVVEG